MGAKGGYVDDTYAAVGMEFGSHTAGWGVDGVGAGVDLTQKGQRGDEPNGAVATHAEVADIVEEHDAEISSGVMWWAEVCPDDDIVATGFEDDAGAQVVVMLAEPRNDVGKGDVGKVGKPGQHDACRLAGSMRIDDVNATHCETSMHDAGGE